MKLKTNFRIILFMLCMQIGFVLAPLATAQESQAKPKPKGGGMQFPVDPRVQMRSYLFTDGDISQNMEYAVYVSSKVSKDKASPLIVTLHGLGAPPQIMFGAKALELAEEGGYILVGPMGFNVSGWYGIPNTPMTGMGAAAKKPASPGEPGQPGAKAAPKAESGQPGAKAAPKTAPGQSDAKPAAKSAGSLFNDPNAPANLRELSEKDVMNVLEMVRKEFNVDNNRIYLMGHSMGGAGTLHLGVKYSYIWAALGPIAPAAFQLNPNSLQEIPKTPIIFVHGDVDEMVPVANTRQWIEKAKELGMTYEYNEMPGVTHGPIIEEALPSIYAFFAKHSRQDGGASITRLRTSVDYAPNGSRRHSRQRYDLRLPDTGEGPFPLLIYIHGGGFSGGNWQLSSNRNGLISAAQSRGYAVASVGYLLMNQSGWSGGQRAFPELVEDVLAAIRHLRANAAEYRLDPDRFAVSGFSAGGYLTAIVCALSNAKNHGYDVTSLGNPGVSHAVQAAASSAALTDFTLLNTHQSLNTDLKHFLDHDATPEGAMLGGNLKDNTESMKKYLTMQNPLTHITANTPPIYMLHGINDNLVPWQQSEIMVNKVNEFAPNKAVLHSVAGRSHADFPSATDPITITILNFLDEKLGIKR